MCCRCDAAKALERTRNGDFALFSWYPVVPHRRRRSVPPTDTPTVIGRIEVQAEGEDPEFTPARLRIRRFGEDAWSAWIETDDLAHAMERLGTDSDLVSHPDPGPGETHPSVRDWILGVGPIEPVIAHVSVLHGVTQVERTARADGYRKIMRANKRKRAKEQRDRLDRRMPKILKILGEREWLWTVSNSGNATIFTPEQTIALTLHPRAFGWNGKIRTQDTRIHLLKPYNVHATAEKMGELLQVLVPAT